MPQGSGLDPVLELDEIEDQAQAYKMKLNRYMCSLINTCVKVYKIGWEKPGLVIPPVERMWGF